MKSFTRFVSFLVFGAILFLNSVVAQTGLYSLTPLSYPFVPLVGATSTSLTATSDDAISAAFPIGFSFVFDGISYTSLRASSNGLLTFNTTGSSTGGNNLATTTSNCRPGMAALWDDLQCTSGVKYKLEGSAPNRVLTVEWLNMEWNYGSVTPVISFQVKLYETTNVIDFVYRQESTPYNPGSGWSATGGASIGLMGVASTNFLSLQNTSTAPTTSSTTSTNNIGTKPATNQVYRFAPPPFPTLTFSSITPSVISCATTDPRQVAVDASIVSGSISTVVLNYSFNGVAQTPIPMTNSSGTTYTATIPAATPANAIVTWNVLATSSFTTASSYAGTAYQDQPVLGLSAYSTASNSVVCSGAASNLNATLFLSSLSATTAPTYTNPSVSDPLTDEDLGSVVITQGSTTILSNTTAGGSLVGTIGTATGSQGSFSNFTAFGPYAMTAGSTYNFSLTSITQGGNYDNSMAIFIDYNRDGDFADAGEAVYLPTTTVTGPHVETGSFTIPSTAFNGLTRMRVVCLETTINGVGSSSSWGEYEDYLINMTGTIQGGGTGTIPAITSVSWSDGTSTLGTGNPFTANPAVTTTYTGTVTAGGCPVVSSPITVNTLVLPAAPIATNSTQCGTQVPTASVASAAGLDGTGMLYWYDAATSGVLVQGPPQTPIPATSCSYTFNLVDAFEDGWNGATMQILDGATVVATIGSTFTSGASATQTVTLTSGTTYTLFWNNAGSYSEEVGITVVNPSGISIYTMAPVDPNPNVNTTLFTISADCSNAPPAGYVNEIGSTTYNSPLASNTTLYVSELGVNGCYSPLSPVSISVSQPAPIVYNNSATGICLGESVTINMSSAITPAYTYEITSPNAGAGVASPVTGATHTFTPTAAGSMPYIVTATNGNCTEVDTVNIMVNNFIPSAPVAVNPLVNICAGVTSQNVAVTPSISAPGVMTTSRTALTKAISNDLIDTKDTLTVGTLPSGSTVTGLSVGINITHTWNSDMNIYLIAPNGTEIELSTGNGGDGDNYTNTIFSTNATAVITSGASPFTGSFLPEGNLGQFLNGTNGQWILKIVDNGFGDDGVLISWSVNVQYSLPAATVWYQTPTSTTSIGTTASIEAIGTPVMSAPAALGTYTFYAAAQDNVPGGCFSATRTPITVNVVSVIAEILPINATCNSVANGSFSLGTISCGATPFTYSVDGGAFGAIPTNLAYGSHTVVVKDATGALAPSVSIFIDQPTWITNVPNFVANGWACKDATSEVISAANPNLSPTDNILIQSNVSVPALVSWTTPGNYTTTFNLNLPVGANVTSATLLVNGLTTTGLTYASDLDFNVSGLGSLSVTPNVSDMVNNLNLSYALTSLNSSSNSVTISIDHYYTGTATIANLSLVVSYTINQTLDNITWYAAPTGGTSIGSGFTLESVGTPVLPNTITPGTYNFYAQGELDGCSSFTRRLVPVTIQAPTVVANIQTATVCPGQFLILNATGGLTYTWSNGAGQNTPFVPAPTAYVGGTQSYVVNGLDIDGCANQDTVVVTVLPQPILNAGVDQAVCVGIPVILNAGTTLQTATPVTGIVWSNAIPNNTQYVPTTSGILTATATGANGCTTQDSVQITVLALPVVNAGQDVTVCAGLSTTLNASGASSYAWNNGVSQGQPFYPNATQTYTVVGTGSNGCTNTDQLIVTVSTGPTVNLSAPQTVCANVPASLSAAVQNSLGGIWTTTNGTGVISPNVTNGTVNYTPSVNDPAVVNLTYVATNACGSASQNTTVTVLPIPVVNAGLDFAVCQGTSATLTATGTGFLTWTTPNVTNGIAFVPTATANYNVVATAANNCTNSDQVTVTVLPLPDVDAGANQTICSGESVTLNGEGAVSYQWTGGASNNVSFAPTTTATYTVTGTGINGCVSSDQVTVVVNATPVATISVVNDITLAASPAGMNYTWINCASGTDVPNGSTANFTAIANGSYAVIVTSAEGCADQSGCEIISSVGLDQIANIEMSVQPNPTAGELTINMPASLKATAQVFDAQGKLVQTESNVENGTVLHLESMTTGVYMVRITADNTVQTFRVVKQ